MPSNEPEVILTPSPETIEQGGRVRLTARLDTSETYFITEASWNFPGRGPFIVQTYDPDDEVTEAKAVWHVPDDQTPGTFDIRVKVTAELQPVRRGSGGSPRRRSPSSSMARRRSPCGPGRSLPAMRSR